MKPPAPVEPTGSKPDRQTEWTPQPPLHRLKPGFLCFLTTSSPSLYFLFLGRTKPAVTSISRSATWPAASGEGNPPIAALSGADRERRDKQVDPFLGRHGCDPLPKPSVGSNPSADPEPTQTRLFQSLSGLGDQHIDHRLLETCGDVGHLLRILKADPRGASWPRIA